MSVDGLGGGIDHESSLRHGVDQLLHVVADIGAVVAGAERGDDLVDERSPSHSPSTSTAVGLSRTTPSGMSSTCSSRTSS